VYALLKPRADAESVSGKMTKLVRDHFQRKPAPFLFQSSAVERQLNPEILLMAQENSNVDAIRKKCFYIKIFSFGSSFVLVIAASIT